MTHIKAHFTTVIKNERDFYVFQYLLEGDTAALVIAAKKKKTMEIKKSAENVYLETSIYYGLTGNIVYDEEKDRYVLQNSLHTKLTRLRRDYGPVIYEEASAVTKDKNWALFYSNHKKITERSSYLVQEKERLERKSSKTKRMEKLFKEIVLAPFKETETISEEVKNIWQLATYIRDQRFHQKKINLNLVHIKNENPTEFFTGIVRDENDRYYEINVEDRNLFFTSMEDDLKLEIRFECNEKILSLNQ